MFEVTKKVTKNIIPTCTKINTTPAFFRYVVLVERGYGYVCRYIFLGVIGEQISKFVRS